MNRMNRAEDHAALERLIDRVCRGQPMRKAPGSMYARIMSAVDRREALPVWRRPFSHWPLALRGGFALVCAIAIIASVRLEPWSAPIDWVRSVVAGAALAGTLGHLVVAAAVDAIPVPWLYAAGVGIATMYAGLAGLAFLAHRTLEYPS